jgi:hypothetical protein
MNGRQRILAHLEGQPVDRLPLMPITMQFACDLIGATYRNYETDHRVRIEGQLRVAEQFDFDYVNTMSDPAHEGGLCRRQARLPASLPAARVVPGNGHGVDTATQRLPRRRRAAAPLPLASAARTTFLGYTSQRTSLPGISRWGFKGHPAKAFPRGRLSGLPAVSPLLHCA